MHHINKIKDVALITKTMISSFFLLLQFAAVHIYIWIFFFLRFAQHQPVAFRVNVEHNNKLIKTKPKTEK